MIEDRQLQELYQQGKNDYEVAALVHWGRDRLRAWRKERGIKSKTTKKGLSKDLCPLIMERLFNGETLTSIGISLGVSRPSITHLLTKNGYKTGHRSRPAWAPDYKLTDIQEAVLYGEMFGDGGITRGGPRTAYYYCGHSIKQKDFVDWKYEIFSPLSCRKKESKERESITMATWSNKSLYDYWRLFYPTGEGDKVILPEMVAKLNWLGMGVWFMGDGTRDRQQVRFSVGKQQKLIPVVEAMNQKFGNMFEAKFYDREWFLKIRNNEAFFKEVSPYLLPYFNYKRPRVPIS